MLEIRTFRSARKGIRVDVLRRQKHSSETGRAQFRYKLIGSFSLSQGYSADLIATLDQEEVLQLQNWLAEARFAEEMGVDADTLAKFPVRMPQSFYEAISHLHLEAKQVDIDFTPTRVMLEALLKTAKLVQQKVDKINGYPSGILESVGINSTQIFKSDDEQQSVDEESRALFKALIELKQPIGKTCSELEKAALAMGKKQRIPPPQLRDWAGDMPGRDSHKRIKKWCFAVAIDVLQNHGINPITLIKPEKVAQYWAIQKQGQYTLRKAQEVFISTFEVPQEALSGVNEAIAGVYKKPSLQKNPTE